MGFTKFLYRLNRKHRGLTLIEVLVVVSIIGMLFAILLPALGKARANARSIACRTNLAAIMTGIHVYSTDQGDAIVPSYNMRGVSGGPMNPLDGWAPILDQGDYVKGNATAERNAFACPDTLDVAGAAAVQTGTDPNKPKGYMDWPTVITLTRAYPTTIPSRGFDAIIRVGYWINGDNPIGTPREFEQGIFFTGSVGYGPDSTGSVMRGNRLSQFRFPGRLVALADGLYAGKQEATRLGDPNSRIGYRHAGRVPTANVGFADGHVSAIEGDKFPRRLDDSLDAEEIRRENLGTGPTIYANPARSLFNSP